MDLKELQGVIFRSSLTGGERDDDDVGSLTAVPTVEHG